MASAVGSTEVVVMGVSLAAMDWRRRTRGSTAVVVIVNAELLDDTEYFQMLARLPFRNEDLQSAFITRLLRLL